MIVPVLTTHRLTSRYSGHAGLVGFVLELPKDAFAEAVEISMGSSFFDCSSRANW